MIGCSQMNPELLKPGAITSIEKQKNNKNRVSLFIDGEFRFGIDEEIIARQNLRVGDHIASEKLSFIIEQEEFRKALSSAYAILARRARSVAEVQEKLLNFGYHALVVEKVVEKLKVDNYLDDRQFAQSFSRSRLASKPMGKMLLLQEIRKRQVPQTMAETVVEEIYSLNPEQELAEKALLKKEKSYQGVDPEVSRQKKIRFLKNRGFSWETIRNVLNF